MNLISLAGISLIKM